MKNFLLLLSFLIGYTFSGMAQDERPVEGRIEAYKIAFLTKKLNLSPEEAQKFWPIYNKYSDEIRRVQIESRQNKIDEIKREELVLNIRKKFNSEFTKALTTDKVNTFFRVEKEFNGQVQKEILERRQQRMEGRNRLRQQ
jgi:hypothetical protein